VGRSRLVRTGLVTVGWDFPIIPRPIPLEILGVLLYSVNRVGNGKRHVLRWDVCFTFLLLPLHSWKLRTFKGGNFAVAI
jgi:hypothetical protein